MHDKTLGRGRVGAGDNVPYGRNYDTDAGGTVHSALFGTVTTGVRPPVGQGQDARAE